MNKKMVKKIFIVDDDDMMAMALEDHLTRNTLHEIHVFTTGEECIKNLRMQPDVIILDYNLNSVQKEAANGMAILDAIKKLNRDIPVVLFSSQDAYSVALQSINKGATQYVIKDEKAFDNIVAICNS
ncbi:MAG: response regulator [Chitinophagaceae bacterium]|nr:response regulator [Chitinophagaceae bacterium]